MSETRTPGTENECATSSPVMLRSRPLRGLGDPADDSGLRLTMPTEGPLVDTYGRIHSDLRISVTDRCNFRCVYCMPEEGVPFLPREQILTYEEITSVARVARMLGVSSVRLTGGEPLIRKGVVGLVRQLAELGFDDVALTTNGTELERLAQPLADAGLTRVNISCDTLRPARFGTIRRRGDLASVLAAMDAAEDAGLVPLKVNVVVMAGVNQDEIIDFCKFAREYGRIVRFIEYMPLDAGAQWDRSQVASAESTLAAISEWWPLVACDPGGEDSAPAERYKFGDGIGEIGIVASVTRPFCGTCNRLRLTADGAIRNCLFSDDEPSVRDVVRRGGSEEELALVLRRAVWGKRAGHGISGPDFLPPARSMSMIGG
ncbi:MAG: GTP 3',8-cyclase MoaA [Acidimicrobiales bacterium]